MTYRELSAIRKEITRKSETLEYLKSRAYKTTVSFDGSPRGSGKSDKVGVYSAEIADIERVLDDLKARYIKALQSLPDEDFEANCIFMRLAFNYGWATIADKVEWNAAAVRQSCRRYEWELTDKYAESIYRVIPEGCI